jgi:hypothetical protein
MCCCKAHCCVCRCREKEALSFLLDASRELSKKRVEFENLFDNEVLIFDGVLDDLADAARVMLGIEDDGLVDELYMTFFNYSFHSEYERQVTIQKLLDLQR